MKLLRFKEQNNIEFFFKNNKIKQILEKKNFVLFYHYDFFNPRERLKMRKIFYSNSLETLISNVDVFKHILLKNPKSYFFLNMIRGNVIMIFSNENQPLEKKIINLLSQNKKLHLICGIWEKKIYRKNELLKLRLLGPSNKKTIPLFLKKNYFNLLTLLVNNK